MANIFTAQHIFSIIFLLIAYFQFKHARNYSKTIMKHGTTTTAQFAPMMMLGNYAAVLGLLIVALSLLFGPLGK